MHDVMPEGVHILPKIKEIFDKLRARIKTKSDLAPCINSLMRNTDLLVDYRSGPQQRGPIEKTARRIEPSSDQHNRQEGDKKLTVELPMEFPQDNQYLKKYF
jgi:hypothetical protein